MGLEQPHEGDDYIGVHGDGKKVGKRTIWVLKLLVDWSFV